MGKSLGWAAFVLTIGLGAVVLTTSASGKKQEGASPMNTTQALMQSKLLETQSLLGALMAEDMGKINVAAEKLGTISKATEWHKGQSPDFLRYSKNFQESVDFLREQAQGKNLEGVAMGYVRLTLTCMQCHNFVREGRTRN